MWWCNSHQRPATEFRQGRYQCDCRLGGILLPCYSVNLDGLVELVREDDTIICDDLSDAFSEEDRKIVASWFKMALVLGTAKIAAGGVCRLWEAEE